MEHFYPPTRAEWRAWLEANHLTATGVWLIYYKKESGKPRVAYDEAVEEALCFGWIDSVPNKIDDESFKQLFSPRKPKSNWSKLNKERVERLTAAGLMMPAGLEKVAIAQQNGAWDALNEVEMGIEPPELTAALNEIPEARQNWDAFSRSTLGIVFYTQGKLDKAVDELTQSVSINPNNAVAHNYLGIAASRKGWQENARKELETAAELDPTYADAYFNLAVVCASQKPPDKDAARNASLADAPLLR
jgi:uncharacterized protein YdeI (YjbR/CyaY-like superfamily)